LKTRKREIPEEEITGKRERKLTPVADNEL